MSTPRLPELPQGQGREELSAWPGMGNRDFTADQMRAYGLAVWKAAMEAAAQLAESDEFYGSALQHQIADAIRSLPDPSATPQDQGGER